MPHRVVASAGAFSNRFSVGCPRRTLEPWEASSVDTYWRQTHKPIHMVALHDLFWDHLQLQWILLQENIYRLVADRKTRARFELLIGFHSRTIHFLQLFLILLPHWNSVFACDYIMLPVPTTTSVLVQVDIIMDELVWFDFIGNQLDSVGNQRGFIGILINHITSSPITTFTIPSVVSSYCSFVHIRF